MQPASPTPMQGLAELSMWLSERRDNARRLAATRSGEDRAGWLEDADYLQRATDCVDAALAQQARAASDETPRHIVKCDKCGGMVNTGFGCAQPACPIDASQQAQPASAPVEAPPERVHAYALELARNLWRKHYQQIAPQREPLPDTLGLLTQIDNMAAGLAAPPAPSPSAGTPAVPQTQDAIDANQA